MSLPELTFQPLLPAWIIAAIGVCCALPLLLGLVRRARGTPARILAAALLLAVLAGPHRIVRVGTSLPDIALLAVDRSGSMRVANRAALASAAEAALLRQAAARPDLHLRTVTVTDAGVAGTTLFAAVSAALADIPPEQRAGVIAITDGQASDVPPRFAGPLAVLLPAAGEQTDRRLRLTEAPGYGIVGQNVEVAFTVDDLGATPGAPATATWSVDGGAPTSVPVTPGARQTISVPISHAGPSVISLAVDALPGEASLLNNRVAFSVNGVRDRLRVLLLSGQPHEGERTWRRLLKADPAVDLVHFTILRPPGKDDLTPINELALIAFPTHQLFVDKIGQFDLIILDRFSGVQLLPPSYLENIADHVRQGGALLVSAGPEFADQGSLADSPIGAILPALPLEQDAVTIGAFRPGVTALGERHPVTEGLAGDVPGETPRWGEWYRHERVTPPHGQVVMQAGSDPLLILDRVEQGRVALLLSDQIWLWSRGHQGGGPQAELLRRVAHWLMKEPELDEDSLTATVTDGTLQVARRTTSAAPLPPTATVTDPDGHTTSLALHGSDAGQVQGSLPAASPGLWQVQVGDRTAYAASAPQDRLEYDDLRVSAEPLRAIATRNIWLQPNGAPTLDSLGLRQRHALRLTGLQTPPLLPPAWMLPLVMGLVLLGWWREGKSQGAALDPPGPGAPDPPS